jgi:hypothetical protein
LFLFDNNALFLFCVDAELGGIFNVDFNSIFGLGEAPLSTDNNVMYHPVSDPRGISKLNNLIMLAGLAFFPSKL